MPTIRTFLALPASAEVQQQIAAVQSRLKAAQADVKWETLDKFHITVQFFGNIEQSNIDPLSQALSRAVESFSAFDISYTTLGAFPTLHNPRVVWIGIQPNQNIHNLQSALEHACSEFGFQKEVRDFHPHITLGRVKGTRNLDRLTEAIKTITFEPMQSRCTEVLLMKSDLRPGGSIYSMLKSFPLQS